MADAPERTKLDQCADCLCNAIAQFCSLTVALSMFIGEIVYLVGVFKLAATWGSFERIVVAHFIAMFFSLFTLIGYFYLFLKGQKQIHFMSFLTGLLVLSFMLVSHSIGLAAPNVLDCGGNFTYLANSFGDVAGGVANDLTNISLNRTLIHNGDNNNGNNNNNNGQPRGEYDQSLLGCYDQAIILGGAIVVGFFQLCAVFDVQRVLLRRVRAKTYGERFTEMGIK